MNFINEKKKYRRIIQLKLNSLIFELIFFSRKPVDHEMATWACCKTTALSQCTQLSRMLIQSFQNPNDYKGKPIDL